MNTLPPSDEHLSELPDDQRPISKTMKLVMAGCIALGVLDAYDDYQFFSRFTFSASEEQVAGSDSTK